jgi:M3 family oligoendopeptidase
MINYHQKREIIMTKFSEMLYKRPDFDQVQAAAKEIISRIKDAESASKVLGLHKEFTALVKDFYTMWAICYVRHSVDTKDEFYNAENDYFDEATPLFTKINVDFYKEMAGSKHRSELVKQLGELWFINAELKIKGFNEKIIEEMQQENVLCSKYSKLIASADLDFDGKKVTLAKLRAYQLSPDRDVRKAAYAKRTEFFIDNAKEFDDLFSELVKLRDEMAKKLGYKNYIELGYINRERNCYSPVEVRRFRDGVKNTLVPFLRELHEQRRRDLEIDKLKFYDEDIYFSSGNPKPEGTPEEMFEAGKRMYAELSSETKDFFSFMMDNELFDVLAKKGKAGGGYCIDFPNYKSPYIFANFNGTSEDVDVLTHECGHALAVFLASEIDIYESMQYTSDIAEIHSMGMEFFTADWMKLFFGKETEKFLYLQLASSLAFIPYGCMVDEFQHIIYENPGMSPDERKAVWKKLEAEYKPHLDYEDDSFFGKGGAWQRQAHIYEIPFYYIDYCLAQTCAIQYRIKMETDFDAAWKSYIELMKKAGTLTFTEIISQAGLKSPFDPECMESIVIGVSKLLKKLKARASDGV